MDAQSRLEPQFASGQALFFAIGDGANGISETPKQITADVNPPTDRGSIFVSRRHNSASTGASSDGVLFVPLSQRSR
ncbi:MAG TPA: hypothetical protein VGU20_18960 [Stellaceae bacterium]|nr:hypothetical protein [Stellaceae bacterium]